MVRFNNGKHHMQYRQKKQIQQKNQQQQKNTAFNANFYEMPFYYLFSV